MWAHVEIGTLGVCASRGASSGASFGLVASRERHWWNIGRISSMDCNWELHIAVSAYLITEVRMLRACTNISLGVRYGCDR